MSSSKTLATEVSNTTTTTTERSVLPAYWRGKTLGIVRRNRLIPTRWQWLRRDERGSLTVSRRSFATPTEAAIWLVRASGKAEGLNARQIGLELLYGVRAERTAPKARTTATHPYAKAEAGSLSLAAILTLGVIMGTTVLALAGMAIAAVLFAALASTVVTVSIADAKGVLA